MPNLKKRYSGGTAANRTIAPLIASRCRAVWFGPDRPEGIAGLSLPCLLMLRFVPPERRPARIWHARRNTEMLLGLVLKALGWRLKLIFNSAGQRRKSRYTDFLIARMDAVIATSDDLGLVRRAGPATVIHHGIDLDLYRPPEDRLAAFAATGLPGKYGDRDLRPRAPAEGQRSVRRGDVPASAEISRFHRRCRRPRLGRQPAVRRDD